MKVNIEIDMTPEEARRLMGLPDFAKLHEIYLDAAMEKFKQTGFGVDIEPIVKSWTGFSGIAQDAFTNMMTAAFTGANPTTKGKS